MGDVRDEPARAGDVPGHARWVRISHWIVTASLLTLAFTGFVILMAHPRLYWGEVGNDLTPALLELPISRNYQHGGWDKPTPFFQDATRARSAPAAPTTSSIRTAGDGVCTSWPHGASCCPASSISCPASSAVTSARTSGPRPGNSRRALVWRDVVDHLRLRIPPASGGPQLRRAAEVRVLVRGLRGGAADGDDRPGDVAGGDRRVSVPVAPVRRLPVRPHDPFLRVRCAPAVRARACRDGHQVRIQTSDPGDDRGRLT